MNPELFNVGPEVSVASTREGILAMGITAAAVLDANQRPLGVASLRDLVGAPDVAPTGERMTSPAVVVRDDARIADAALLIGETGYRHLVVVDGTGRAVGMVSAVDLVRALSGLPAQHPQAFPHLDTKTGLTWTDDTVLNMGHLGAAPRGPGLIVLVHDAPGLPRRVVWVESAENALIRLTRMLTLPQESPELARWLQDPAQLRFRVAVALETAALGQALVDALREKERAATMSGRCCSQER